jgi:hypothetical protein
MFAVISLHADAALKDVAQWGLALALGALLICANPLLPSDGLRAMEAAFGAINLRARSLGALALALSPRPCDASASQPRAQRMAMVTLGLVWLAYAVLCVALSVQYVLHLLAGEMT